MQRCLPIRYGNKFGESSRHSQAYSPGVHLTSASVKVPKSAGVKQQAVYRAIQDRIETWLRMIVASRS